MRRKKMRIVVCVGDVMEKEDEMSFFFFQAEDGIRDRDG